MAQDDEERVVFATADALREYVKGEHDKSAMEIQDQANTIRRVLLDELSQEQREVLNSIIYHENPPAKASFYLGYLMSAKDQVDRSLPPEA